MEAINVFELENREGRFDVARAVGSTALSMSLYELVPGAQLVAVSLRVRGGVAARRRRHDRGADAWRTTQFAPGESRPLPTTPCRLPPLATAAD